MFDAYDWGTLSIQNVIAVRSAKPGTVYDSFGSKSHYQLAIKFRGKTIVHYANKEYVFGANDVIYIPKEKTTDVPYSREIIAQGEGVCIFFDSVEPLCEEFCVFHCGKAVKNAFSLLSKIYNASFRSNSVDCMRQFYQLLCLIRDEYEGQKADMNAIEQYILHHLCDSYIDISELAAIDGTSKEYFRHKFKTKFGVSILEYIHMMKIGRAKKLLCENRYSVSEIAKMVGFSDPNYFARFFKKKCGITPTGYMHQYCMHKNVAF